MARKLRKLEPRDHPRIESGMRALTEGVTVWEVEIDGEVIGYIAREEGDWGWLSFHGLRPIKKWPKWHRTRKAALAQLEADRHASGDNPKTLVNVDWSGYDERHRSGDNPRTKDERVHSQRRIIRELRSHPFEMLSVVQLMTRLNVTSRGEKALRSDLDALVKLGLAVKEVRKGYVATATGPFGGRGSRRTRVAYYGFMPAETPAQREAKKRLEEYDDRKAAHERGDNPKTKKLTAEQEIAMEAARKYGGFEKVEGWGTQVYGAIGDPSTERLYRGQVIRSLVKRGLLVAAGAPSSKYSEVAERQKLSLVRLHERGDNPSIVETVKKKLKEHKTKRAVKSAKRTLAEERLYWEVRAMYAGEPSGRSYVDLLHELRDLGASERAIALIEKRAKAHAAIDRKEALARHRRGDNPNTVPELTEMQHKKRVAQLRRQGYTVKMVDVPGLGTVVYKSKKKASKKKARRKTALPKSSTRDEALKARMRKLVGR